MAVRFLIVFILIACGASAQVFQTNNVPYKFRGLKADSMLVVPSGADTANLANPKWGENMNGALFAKTGDSTLWMKVGTRWVKVSSTATTIDTTSLSNRINQKLNISDTAAMLLPYLRKADTASLSNRINLKVDSITSSNDSLYYYVNGTKYYVSSFTGFDTAVVVKAQVHNAESTTLLAGEVVYGFSSTGNLLSVKRANNKLESTSSKTFGIVRKDIPAGGIGWIVTNGVVDKLNLGAYTAGQEVYLDSINGQFTATKPLAPYNMVFVGIVERANAGNGQLYVKIQNGFELYELHNVSAMFPSNNQVLKFRASDSLWHNATDTGITSLTAGVGLTGGTITTTGTIAADTNVLSTRAWRQKGLDSIALLELSLADTAAMLNPYARGSGANGRVSFWNGTRSITGSDSLFWDNANRRLGINTNSPISKLNVNNTTGGEFTATFKASGIPLPSINIEDGDITIPNYISANFNPPTTNNTVATLGSGGSTIGGMQIFAFSNNTDERALFFSGLSGKTTATLNSIITLRAGKHDGSTNVTTLSSNDIAFQFNNWTTPIARFWGNGNLLLQNGGIFTDNGFRLDVNGTGRYQSTLKVGAATATNASAALDVESTTRGFLPPRMTAAQRTGIANTAGLLVWDSDSARYMVNNGSAWRGLPFTFEAGGVNALSAIGSTPNANGATISGTTLNLQPASASFGGVVTTGTQTFTGDKTFQGLNTSTTNFRSTSSSNFVQTSLGRNTAEFDLGVSAANDQFITGSVAGTNIIKSTNGNPIMIGFGGQPPYEHRFKTGIGPQYLLLQNGATNNTWMAIRSVEPATGNSNSSSLDFGIVGSANSFFNGTRQYDLVIKGYSGDNSRNLLIGSTNSNNPHMVLFSTSQNIGINNINDVTSALLHMTSTSKGFLQPRMTSTQRNAISTPAIGLSVYDSTDKTIDVYDGTRWNNTPNGLKNSATLDFGSTAAQTSADLTITVTGAAEGDMVFLGTPNGAVNANTNFTAWVSATNTVTIRFNNYSSGSVDPASGTFRVYVIKN